jgi:hypothetical protein
MHNIFKSTNEQNERIEKLKNYIMVFGVTKPVVIREFKTKSVDEKYWRDYKSTKDFMRIKKNILSRTKIKS